MIIEQAEGKVVAAPFVGVEAVRAAMLARRFLEPLIEATGEYTFSGLLKEAADGKMQVWLVGSRAGEVLGALITEVQIYPRKKLLHVVYGAGLGMEIFNLILPDLETFAEMNGAGEIRLVGRHGLTRVLAGVGFKAIATVLEKKLERRIH